MIIGFTGTRRGMTFSQMTEFAKLIDWFRPTTFVHGGCIGADEQAHKIVRRMLEGKINIRVYPADVPENLQGDCPSDFVWHPLPPLKRNKIIVDQSEVMIATPYERTEKIRSGTWSTIRYSWNKGKSVRILFP